MPAEQSGEIGDATSFRRATAQDASAVRALTRDAYAEWVPLIGREPLPMTADYDRAVIAHHIDLLHLEDRLAGLIEMVPADGHLLIENVAVAPAFRGRGLGIKLMARAEEIATSLGCDEIRLYTNKLFARNVSLYQRLGYRVDREETWSGGTIVHMSKAVAR